MQHPSKALTCLIQCSMLLLRSMTLIEVRDNLIRHQLAILQPVIPIFAEAFLLVSKFSVDEEDREVYYVEVSNDHSPASSFSLNDFNTRCSPADEAAIY